MMGTDSLSIIFSWQIRVSRP